MTFTETKELLEWARVNQVAEIKLGEVHASFYPTKSTPELVSTPSRDWRKEMDRSLGLNLDEDAGIS